MGNDLPHNNRGSRDGWKYFGAFCAAVAIPITVTVFLMGSHKERVHVDAVERREYIQVKVQIEKLDGKMDGIVREAIKSNNNIADVLEQVIEHAAAPPPRRRRVAR